MRKRAFFTYISPESMAQAVGVLAGLGAGRKTAPLAAAEVAPRGRKTRSVEAAKMLGLLGGPLGAIGALALARKGLLTGRIVRLLKKKAPGGILLSAPAEEGIVRGLLPMFVGYGGGALGGALTGAGIGGLQRLRGSPYKRPKLEKKASFLNGFIDELMKMSQALPPQVAMTQQAGPRPTLPGALGLPGIGRGTVRLGLGMRPLIPGAPMPTPMGIR